jgi:FtsH-binding integral membrane protein
MQAVSNYQYGTVVANSDAEVRADFIRKTYMHLTGAVVAFTLLSSVLLSSGVSTSLLMAIGNNRMGWFLVMLAFMGVSYVANSWANSATSLGLQYAGLVLYVVAEAVIMSPLILIAYIKAPDTIPAAAGITLAMFAGITLLVFVTGKNFSFMGSILGLAGLVAMGLIVCSMIFGFNLGVYFTIAMIAMACGYILYGTSNVIHTYRVGQHVAASLALFASVALLFWYVLQLLLSMSKKD